jgi:hypothetical protein
MATNGQNQRTQLLSDAPADEDAFEGGHDRVAEALADLIREEDGGKAVALRGPYGSGKSTVIEILEDKIEDDGETRIFTYDAWEHQGDPLRRSFIESLIEFLRQPFTDPKSEKEKRWAGENAWKNEIERIASRKEKTEIDTEPKLTTWGRVIALLLFVAPLGAFVVNNFISGFFGGVQWSPPEVYWWVGGAILFVLPVLAVAGAWIFGDDPFYVFVQESHHEEETKTIKTPDPTTIEFQGIFRRILCQTLHGNDRQLILVVDNLDRLPAEDAFSTWATMRTFFEREDGSDEEWVDRFWLVAPFNFEALRSVFEEDGKVPADTIIEVLKEDGKQEDGEQDEGDKQKDDEDKSVSDRLVRSESAEDLQAFIDKTFAATFRVAPPVLSDWEQFMEDQLREAFPEHGSGDGAEETFHTVYKLYRIEGVEGGAVPTPRDIKLFINQLSVLYRQWGDQMSLPVLAAYTLTADEINRDGDQIKNPDFLDRRVRSELQSEIQDESWQEKFASLHFNVEDEAVQVLIGERVRDALTSGDSDLLTKEAGVAGFESVLETQVSEIVDEEDAKTSAFSANALRRIEIEKTETKESIWDDLLDGLEKDDSWYPITEDHGRGVVKILEENSGTPSDDTVSQLLTAFSKVDSRVGDAWAEGVAEVIEYLQRVGYEDLLRSELEVPGEGEEFLDSMRELASYENGEDLAHFFTPQTEISNVDAALGQKAQDEATPDYSEAVHLMAHVGKKSDQPSWKWEETVNVLRDILKPNSGASEREIQATLKILLVIAALHEDESAINFLSANDGQGLVLHRFHQNSDKVNVQSICCILSLLYNPEVGRGNNVGNARQGQNSLRTALENPDNEDALVEEVSAILADESQLLGKAIEAASEADRFQPFMKHVLRKTAQSSGVHDLVTTDSLCEHPEVVVDALLHDGLDTLIETKLSDGKLKDQLHEVKLERWKRALHEESRLLDLLLSILRIDSSLHLPSGFREALIHHAEDVLNGESPSRLRGEWSRFLNLLPNEDRETFFREIQELLLQPSGQQLAPVLELYEDPLLESGAMASSSLDDADTVVDNHLVHILNRGNTHELKWLLEVLREHEDLLERTSKNTRDTFKKQVSEAANDLEGNRKDLISEIADVVGVELSEEAPEDSESE